MRGKLWFLGGLAAGFVLGARAGREKYDELMQKGRELLNHPTVQEATGLAQSQATRLLQQGKERLGQTKLGEKINMGDGSHAPGGMPTPTTTGAAPTGSTMIKPPGSTT